MCLLVLAWQAAPRYRLAVAANRDEYHERPAQALAKWPEPPGIIAGRDLRASGTWLGVDPERRFGVVTNFRELQPPRRGAPSRGELIPRYLAARTGPGAEPARAGEFFAALEAHAAHYAGFNLLLSDDESLWYGSNRATPFARPLTPGVYGLSNELLDTPWPKLQRVRRGFEDWLARAAGSPAELFELLNDRTRVEDDAAVPAGRSGLPREWERILSAPFVLHPEYGTRCSTVLLEAPHGGLYLAERRFDSRGEVVGETEFNLNPGEWP
ncbi:MAG: NRDE family protein [Gammaproteobacteria bacterium]|nr:MAG: NRDE family protein [Gammaproteobacteria bacterium]TLZ10603.1 MAG: NRDE family protein [Gammaproteobacteria bacterium]